MLARRVLRIALVLVSLSTAHLFAATVFVDLPLGVNYFKPRSILISVGDTVTWRNPTGGGLHGVKLDDGTIVRIQQTGPWTASFTFNNPGTFAYYCQIHGSINGQGMSGIVFVGNRTFHAANEHILQLNAWDFGVVSSSSTTGGSVSNGLRTATGGATFVSGIHLRSGSEMTGMEIVACDSDAGAGLVAQLSKCNDELYPCVPVANVVTTGTPGCTFFSSPFSEFVDDLGSEYFVQIDLAGTVGFRDVRIYYRNPLSYAPATATFTDVPTTHPFYRFVEALAAAGVTGGCNAAPPQYCPDTPVTRGQMAVFLAQALGLFWPY